MPLPVNTRKVAYTAVMRNASANNRDGFETLLKLYKQEQLVQEKSRVLRCIASSPDPSLVLEALNFMLSNEANWDRIIEKYGNGMVIHYFVRDIITPFSSHERADAVEAFFASRLTTACAMNLKQVFSTLESKQDGLLA